MHRLTLDADVAFNDVVRVFVERGSARVLGADGVADLARAGEEVFTYVAEQAGGTSVRFSLEPRPYAAFLEVAFDGVAISPSSFNLTHDVDPDDELQLDLPLLLAARSVDRFDIDLEPGAPVRIRLQRDRSYPPAAAVTLPRVTGAGAFRVEAGSPELLGYFAGLLAAGVDAALLPDFARHGARLMDMVTAGEVTGALAVNADQQIGGGILWTVDPSRSVVRFFGPYVLAEGGREALATLLVEAFIGTVSRSQMSGVFSRHVTDDLPLEYFEVLGSLEGAGLRAVYRGLQEDHAAAVWFDPVVRDFLEARQEELALAREMRPVLRLRAGRRCWPWGSTARGGRRRCARCWPGRTPGPWWRRTWPCWPGRACCWRSWTWGGASMRRSSRHSSRPGSRRATWCRRPAWGMCW